MHSHNTNSKRQGRGKQNQQSNEDECPICGQEYAEKHIISKPTHWKDLYQGTAFDYLTRFRRRCSARVDVEKGEGQEVGAQEVVLYFHGDTRKRNMI